MSKETVMLGLGMIGIESYYVNCLASQAARQGQAVLRATADVVLKTENIVNFHEAPHYKFLIDRG